MKKFDLSKIVYSRRDKEKGIIIPTYLTPKLAEDLGIHFGDGSLYRAGSFKTLEFIYSGHIAEKDHMLHIASLKKELYNIKGGALREKGNELRLRIYSYAVAMFYTQVIGFPVGSKRDIGVLPVILNSNQLEIIAGFLRGLIDTDFSLIIVKKYGGTLYPVLRGKFASRQLIIDLEKLFEKLGIKSSISLDIKSFHNKAGKTYIGHTITISGFKRVGRWLKLIGYSNKIKFEKKVMGLEGLSEITFEPPSSSSLKP